MAESGCEGRLYGLLGPLARRSAGIGRGAKWIALGFIQVLMAELSERIASEEFAQIARHPDFPKAFTRNSKLPLPALIAALLSMRNQSQQAMLDGFFASVHDTATPVRAVTDRAFATARNHLHLPALTRHGRSCWQPRPRCSRSTAMRRPRSARSAGNVGCWQRQTRKVNSTNTRASTW